jgi:hypothetical protein
LWLAQFKFEVSVVALLILRCVFFMVAAGLGTFFATGKQFAFRVSLGGFRRRFGDCGDRPDHRHLSCRASDWISFRRSTLESWSDLFLTYAISVALTPLLLDTPYSQKIHLVWE